MPDNPQELFDAFAAMQSGISGPVAPKPLSALVQRKGQRRQTAQAAEAVLGDALIKRPNGEPDYAAMASPEFFMSLPADAQARFAQSGLGHAFQSLARNDRLDLSFFDVPLR